MKPRDSDKKSEPNDQLGMDRFIEAVRRMEGSRRIFVPPAIDKTILGKAREHFDDARSDEPQEPRWWLRWGWLLAGGVGMAILALTSFTFHKPVARMNSDINGDGQVDVLDAMALAKLIHSGEVRDARLDLNRDQRVDHQDQKIVEEAAVRLPF